jgi:hypothetical protein
MPRAPILTVEEKLERAAAMLGPFDMTQFGLGEIDVAAQFERFAKRLVLLVPDNQQRSECLCMLLVCRDRAIAAVREDGRGC